MLVSSKSLTVAISGRNRALRWVIAVEPAFPGLAFGLDYPVLLTPRASANGDGISLDQLYLAVTVVRL